MSRARLDPHSTVPLRWHGADSAKRDAPVGRSCSDGSHLCFKQPFRSQVGQIPTDRRDGQGAFAFTVAHRTVVRTQRSFNYDGIPFVGMPDVVDCDVVVLAPEEWGCSEWLTRTENVPRRDLSLALRYDPVLHPDPLTRVRIGPSCNITGGEYARCTCFEVFVDCNAAIDRQPRRLGERNGRPHAHTENDEVGLQGAAIGERYLRPVYASRRLPEMESDAMLFVKCLHEAADFRAEHAFQWHSVEARDVHLDTPGA